MDPEVGWTTSSRMPGDTKPCLFGCDDGNDRLEHYIGCPSLHYHARRALAPRRLHGPWMGYSAAEFLGLVEDDTTVEARFRPLVFCTFYYHQRKHSSRVHVSYDEARRLMQLGRPCRGKQAGGATTAQVRFP